jgi:hypothetical protein
MHRIIATAALIALSSAHAANAETVTLDVAPQTQLQMQVPQGFCPVRAGQSDLDKAVLAFFERTFKGEAKLLAYFMDCKAYADLGTDSYAAHSWMFVLAPVDQDGNPLTLPGEKRAQVLDEIAKRATQNRNAPVSDIAFVDPERSSGDPGVDLTSQNRTLGVLDTDGNAVYQGLLSRVAANGTSGNVAGLINSTFVADHLININAYAAYDTPQAFEDLIEFSKTVAKEFISANEPPAHP